MRPRLLLQTIVALGLGLHGAEARSPARVCHDIAAMLKAGLGNSPAHVHRRLLTSLARNSRGRLSIATWHDDGGERKAILHALAIPASPESPMTAASRGRRLLAVMSYEGSAGCMDVTLFHSLERRLVQVSAPYVTRITACSRWGDAISLGDLGGRPFVAKETGGDSRIDVAPWNGHGWDKICSVEISYVPSLVSEKPVCHLDDCAVAEAETRRIIAREEGGLPAQKSSDPRLGRLLDLSDVTPGMYRVLAPPGLANADAVLVNRAKILTTISGRPTLVVTGDWLSSPAIDSQPIGVLAGLWQADGDKLIPVAGFHFRTAHSIVKSVSVAP